MAIVTVVIGLVMVSPRTSSPCMAWMKLANPPWCVQRYHAPSCSNAWPICHPAWSAGKPAPVPTTGPGSLPSSATPCGVWRPSSWRPSAWAANAARATPQTRLPSSNRATSVQAAPGVLESGGSHCGQECAHVLGHVAARWCVQVAGIDRAVSQGLGLQL